MPFPVQCCTSTAGVMPIMMQHSIGLHKNCQFCLSGDNEDKLLLCDGCDKGFHMYCFKPHHMEAIPEGDWYCHECRNKASGERNCIVCGKRALKNFLLCDHCPRAYHLYCLSPPLSKVPRGKWSCNSCAIKFPRKKAGRKSGFRKSRDSKSRDDHRGSGYEGETDGEDAPLSSVCPRKEKECATLSPIPSSSCNNAHSVINDEPPLLSPQLPFPGPSNKLDRMSKKVLPEEVELQDYAWPVLLPVITVPLPSFKNIMIKSPMDLSTKKKRSEDLSEGETDGEDAPPSSTCPRKEKECAPLSPIPSSSFNNAQSVINDEPPSLSPQQPSPGPSNSKDRISKKLCKELSACKVLPKEVEVQDDAWSFLLPVNTEQSPTDKKITKSPKDLSTKKKRLRDDLSEGESDREDAPLYSECLLKEKDCAPLSPIPSSSFNNAHSVINDEPPSLSPQKPCPGPSSMKKRMSKKLCEGLSAGKVLPEEVEVLDDSWAFLLPVNTEEFLPYRRIVKSAMDLSTSKKRLSDDLSERETDGEDAPLSSACPRKKEECAPLSPIPSSSYNNAQSVINDEPPLLSPQQPCPGPSNKMDRMSKKLCKNLSACKVLLEEMEVQDDAWPFLRPVNTNLVPTHKTIIKIPMDLSTIKKRLCDDFYKTKEEFVADVRQIFNDCETLNEDDSPVGKAGHTMRSFFEMRWAELSATKTSTRHYY